MWHKGEVKIMRGKGWGETHDIIFIVDMMISSSNEKYRPIILFEISIFWYEFVNFGLKYENINVTNNSIVGYFRQCQWNILLNIIMNYDVHYSCIQCFLLGYLLQPLTSNLTSFPFISHNPLYNSIATIPAFLYGFDALRISILLFLL